MKGHWEKGKYIIGNKYAASWSKWGGPREGYQKEELPQWVCQACGKDQLRVFPEYLLLLDDETREYLRICTECKFRSVVSDSRSFAKLRVEIRTRDIKEYLGALNALATFPLPL